MCHESMGFRECGAALRVRTGHGRRQRLSAGLGAAFRLVRPIHRHGCWLVLSGAALHCPGRGRRFSRRRSLRGVLHWGETTREFSLGTRAAGIGIFWCVDRGACLAVGVRPLGRNKRMLAGAKLWEEQWPCTRYTNKVQKERKRHAACTHPVSVAGIGPGG